MAATSQRVDGQVGGRFGGQVGRQLPGPPETGSAQFPPAVDPSGGTDPSGGADSPGRRPWWQPDWRHSRAPWLVLVAILTLVVASIWQLGHPGPAPLTREEVAASITAQLQKAQQEQAQTPPDAATAYRRIVPSLVTITAGKALGTGVVINAQGAVLTALHVVSGGGAIKLRFADGTEARGKVTQQKPDSDIAVLAADVLPSVVVPAVMGGEPQVGDTVFPVGNPLGLEGSLSAGVVSGLQRTIRSDQGGSLKGLIQFDAAVNPGNSGGPLLDRAGQVVGIVTGLANPSKQPFFVGIGFAVPIETAGGAAGGPSK